MQEPKAGRRIVSKGEYYSLRGIFALLKAQGMFMILAGTVGFIYLFVRWHSILMKHPTYTMFMITASVIFVAAGLLITRKANTASEDVGVPLTHANAAELPSPDSLVRASQEPAQAQEGVLLRASSGEAQAGQEEQLLRASTGE